MTASVNYYEDKVRLIFTGSVLQQKTVTCSYKKVVNLYVVFEVTNFHWIDNYPTPVNALFGAICLSVHYNGANSYLFVNGREIHQFTTQHSQIVPNNLCLENVSKNLSPSDMKKLDIMVIFINEQNKTRNC